MIGAGDSPSVAALPWFIKLFDKTQYLRPTLFVWFNERETVRKAAVQ
jgi:hypothetical protein